MAKFNKGDIVINVNTNEKGSVVDVLPKHRGKQFYDVMVNGQVLQCSENNLIADVNLSDPFEKLKRGIFSTYETFLQTTTAFKIQNTSLSNISTLKSSKTLFRAYQFKPLLKLLNSSNRRLLVADEVGLGKTIEAGHVMLELKARRELRNCLIVCPISLQLKWQDELTEKFNLRFKIYDTMKELIADFKSQTSVMGIINYEKIRKPKEQKDDVPGTNIKSPKETLADYLQSSGKRIDLLVCDEAHRARNHETQTFKGLKAIMDCTKAAIFLTATPIMISRENLFNLLRLLNETEYTSYSIFENALRVNEPFIRALGRLNNREDFVSIAKELEETEVTTITEIGDYKYPETLTIRERFKEIPLYRVIIDTLKKGQATDELRVQLQFDISSLSKMNNIFSRTRKREVTQDYSQAERNPHTYYVTLHEEEREEFDRIIEEYIEDNSYVDEWGCDVMRPGTSLGLVQKKRQVSSSVYAFMNEIESLERGIDAYKSYPDAKFEKLLEIIDEVVTRNRKKLIVFALFHKTLHYLRLRLKDKGFDSVLMYGGTKNRGELLMQFRDDTRLKILLTSEVGGEGLDMQFCDAMVNYDLPWNPMVVEQRIGRIDRFGQKSPKVNIYNLIVENSIQEIIYKRLLDRIGIFRSSVGDLEAILDRDLERDDLGVDNLREYFSSLEKELYTTKLTNEERERKVKDVADAVITEKKNAEMIEEQLTNALTNDISFRNEIEKILHRKQYVTDNELVSFIEQLIRLRLTTCRLEVVDTEKKIFDFIIPKATPRVLTSFLTEYQPTDSDLAYECINLRNKLRDETEIRMTFSQDTAYNQKGMLFINSFHPIILAALEYFKRNLDLSNEDTYRYRLYNTALDKGRYCLAMYELRYSQNKFGKEQVSKVLFPVVYDLENQSVIEDTELAKNIWGEAQENAKILSITEDLSIDIVNGMKIDLSDAIEEFDQNIFEDQQRRMESVKLLDIQRTKEYYKNQIKRQKDIIANTEYLAESPIQSDEAKKARQILPAQRGRLVNMEEEMKSEINRLSEMTMTRFTPVLKSLSYIYVNQ